MCMYMHACSLTITLHFLSAELSNSLTLSNLFARDCNDVLTDKRSTSFSERGEVLERFLSLITETRLANE